MRNRKRSLISAVFCLAGAAAGCSTDARPPADISTVSAALVSIQNDFEDGSPQGWVPRGGSVVLTNTTQAAFTGTHSLATTGRTAGFNGPSLNVTSQLAKGATYQVGVSVRLVAGSAPTTIRVTMQRTPTGGSAAF